MMGSFNIYFNDGIFFFVSSVTFSEASPNKTLLMLYLCNACYAIVMPERKCNTFLSTHTVRKNNILVLLNIHNFISFRLIILSVLMVIFHYFHSALLRQRLP